MSLSGSKRVYNGAMETFLYVLFGFAIGVEVGRYQKGGTCDWKKAALTAGIAIVVAVAIVLVIRWLR